MTPAEWQRARALFEAAVERPQAERHAFVIDACAAGGSSAATIRDRVLAMLVADDAATRGDAGLAEVAPDLFAQFDDDPGVDDRQALIGTRVGPWKLVRQLGHGGMGAVYLAERVAEDFEQRAAIKRLAAEGMSDYGIASATKLSVEQVRLILAEPVA